MTNNTRGFSVSYADLMVASHDFRAQAAAYNALMPQDGFGSPKAGSAVIDDMLLVTLKTIGEAHFVLYEVADAHGRKLYDSAFDYSESDKQIDEILRQVQKASPLGSNADPVPNQAAPVPAPPTTFTGRILGHLTRVQPKDAGATPVNFLFDLISDYVSSSVWGLQVLAKQLYQFGSSSYDIVAVLNGRIEKIISDELWTGWAASSFQDAYEQDALLIFQLAGIAIEAGDITNSLACQLASTEADLESALQTQADAGTIDIVYSGSGPTQPTYTPGRDPKGYVIFKGDVMIIVLDNGPAQTMTNYSKIESLIAHYCSIADGQRKSAAGALAALCDASSKIITYYQVNGGAGGQLEFSGLLGSNELHDLTTQMNSLQKEFDNAYNELHLKSPSQLSQLASAANTASGLSQNANDILSNTDTIKQSAKEFHDGGFLTKVTKASDIANGGKSIVGDLIEGLPLLFLLAE